MHTEPAPDSESEVGVLLAPVYRTLGELYLEPPTERNVAAIEEWCVTIDEEWDLQTDAGSTPAKLGEAVGVVREADPDLDELRGAFTRLLQGVGRGELPAPPYESLYVDGVLNGPSSTEVQAFYLEAGLELAVEEDLIDHAGYELAFLAELCERGDPERELGFIRTHLGDWIGEFHAETEPHDPPPFYRGVFALTESLLDLHADLLEGGP